MPVPHLLRRSLGLGALGWAAVSMAAAGAEPLRVSELDRPPRPILQVPPVYPYGMKMAGLVGKVKMEYVVNAAGRVSNPFVLGSNNPWFERPAIDAVLKWKFKPGTKDGRAVNTRVVQEISFQFEDREGNDLWRAQKPKDHEKLPLELRWDAPPVPVASNYPVYPAEALRANRKGRAVVRFVVGLRGDVETAKVVEATAPEFGGAAMASVDAWRFQPARRAGAPCRALIQMDFDFRPGGGSSVPVSAGMTEVVRELARKAPRIYGLEQLDATPRPVSRRPPIYPSALLKESRPGSAVIEFYIDENGDAQLPRVVSASASEFGYAAAQAVASWRFQPALRAGRPVTARAQIPIDFAVQAESDKSRDHPNAVAQP